MSPLWAAVVMWLPHALAWLLIAATVGLLIRDGEPSPRATLGLAIVGGLALAAAFVVLVSA